ncbi:hypothetical protein [Amycolatopsis sp. YIM 10]|uniref:hypothetical protein n=1 Tax=Amycolatopsis sp. YIM 10 TaxID=2653857 RepID=UPI0012900A0F|nr:hypothetical protein [Amycolatopsis sp. YIM 10]QFU92288.1 Cell division protein FtsL [Amycolatopsis sp. YIM 10]
MTAPARSRTRARTEQRGTTGRTRTSAAERAYARRAQRAAEAVARPERQPDGAASAVKARPKLKLKLRLPRSRASFVLLMMGLLAVGVVTTLWLSTQAIADSYRLDELRKDNAGLVEQAERLQREVTKQESTSSLDERAKALGMVPGGDPARIIVNPDGGITVIGEPKKATPPAAPGAGDQSEPQDAPPPIPAVGGGQPDPSLQLPEAERQQQEQQQQNAPGGQ